MIQPASQSTQGVDGLPDFSKAQCPERRALDLISERWTGLVVIALSKAPVRYNALRRLLSPISQRMLTRTLRRLEQEGLVKRNALGGNPPQVSYELTSSGHSMLSPLRAISEWGRRVFSEADD